MKQPLPIDDVLPQLVQVVRTSPSVVLQAPPGAGKTTRVPPALLDAQLVQPNRWLILEPRRIAARSAAQRMSVERGTAPGEMIGWHVRFERQATSRTALLCVTPGMLLRYLHDDPFLEQFGGIIFDEFHERGLENDLAFGLLRLVQQNIRTDLRIVIMSATLDTAALAQRLQCPIVQSEGRAFPVTVRYQSPNDERAIVANVADAVRQLYAERRGDVLAFLPGVGEIRGVADELHGLAATVLPLHGELPVDEQDRALRAHPTRKIVLATNVAETSVTVEGITTVVDCGFARQLSYDATVGLDRLQLVKIAQSSAEQRAGRAGRLEAGLCVRLWSEVSHRSRLAHTPPEIVRVDSCGPALQLLALGENPFTFDWLDAPPTHVVQQAMSVLEHLGAVRHGELTPLGASLARLPVQPRLARLLVEGANLGQPQRAARAAALLSERSPFARNDAPHATSSDLLEQLEALEGTVRLNVVNRGALRFIEHTAKQLERSLDDLPSTTPMDDADEAIQRALLAAFPDRVCRRRDALSRRGVMVGGRGVRLGPTSGVTEAELFLALDVDAGSDETVVRMASAVAFDWLVERGATTAEVVEYDEATDRLRAVRQTCFHDLVLREKPLHLAANDARMVEALTRAAIVNLDRIRPVPESPAGQLLIRLQWLHAMRPELNLPAFDEADWAELCSWLVPGCRSLADVRNANWEEALRNKLTHLQRTALDREAPERLEVPTGNRIALTYSLDRPPVLAVRIQELFGLATTPTLAGGRVKVILHLLAPNYRPQQVTDDLASFWANTYPVVRKELRGRYPKHAWPEDPLTAEATSRPKPRS